MKYTTARLYAPVFVPRGYELYQRRMHLWLRLAPEWSFPRKSL